MKKLTLILIVIVLASCKRPYDSYRSSYRTTGAVEYHDKTITPGDAVKKNIKSMNLAQARAARIYFEERDETDLIEKVLLHIMKLSDNYQEKADCLYELATLYLALGNLEKARDLYEKLIQEYPGVSFKKEAAYRRILAHYWHCSDAQRDPAMTEKTLELVKEFKKEFVVDAEYAESLQTIEDCGYDLLFKGEMLRLDFYLTRYAITKQEAALKAAQLRLGYILEKLIEKRPSLSSHVKDELVDLYVQLKELDDAKAEERVALLHKAYALLSGTPGS